MTIMSFSCIPLTSLNLPELLKFAYWNRVWLQPQSKITDKKLDFIADIMFVQRDNTKIQIF